MNCTRSNNLISPADAQFRRNRLVLIAVCALTFALAAAYAPHVQRGPVICPLHGLLGLPCPGCGLTRAFCALTRGDVIGALGHNALGLPLAAIMLAAPFVALRELRLGRRLAFYRFLYSARVAWVFAGVVLTYHLGRVAWMIGSGTLVESYVKTSWTHLLWQTLGL